MIIRFFCTAWLLLVAASAQAQMRRLLGARPDTTGLSRVLARPGYYRLQISLVRIRRDGLGQPHAQRPVTLHLRRREYFYPASTVKLAAAVFALEKLDSLHQVAVPALHLYSPMRTDSACCGQTCAWRDASAADGRASLGHYLRKMLLVSDNEAYNRLYEFVGPRQLSAGLRRLGLHRARVVQRLAIGDHEPNSRYTNPIRFYADTAERQLLYSQPAAYWAAPLPSVPMRRASMLVGRAYLGRHDSLVQKPFDLRHGNRFALRDLQRLLQAAVLPETVPARRRPRLTPVHQALLSATLAELPPHSQYPRYDSAEYPRTYAKYLLGGGGLAQLPPGVRVLNKIGQAYGFLTDNAYVVDTAHGVEFLLAATLYVNADGVLNDNQYEYAAIGLPFLRDLGWRVYEAELRRRGVAR